MGPRFSLMISSSTQERAVRANKRIIKLIIDKNMLSFLPASLSSTGVELELGQELLLDEKESTFNLGVSWGGAPSSPGMILFLP